MMAGTYGLRVLGTIMEPRYEPGEVIWLNPNIPGKAGDDVLLFPANESVDQRRCLRRLVAESETEWTVRQYNPPATENLSKSLWVKCVQVQDNR
jgi:phage repressor protein C with HTH and peptisase S24 domain